MRPVATLVPQTLVSVQAMLSNLDRITTSALTRSKVVTASNGLQLDVPEPDLNIALQAQLASAKLLALYQEEALKPTEQETRKVSVEYLLNMVEKLGYERPQLKEETKEPDGKHSEGSEAADPKE